MKIVIVDDDRLVGISLKTIIEASGEAEVAAVGYNGLDAIRLYADLKPDILLMDIRMDAMTGLEAGARILQDHPEAKILYLTTFADDEYIVRALKIGAKGYILKQDFESILPALKAVYAGQSVFGEDIVAKIPSLLSRGEKTDLAGCGVTGKEAEIIALIAEGLSNREIAGRLYLSEGTVRNSISVIMDKLSFKRRTQLAIFYYKSARE
ncbi:two component transcriptional regulator, LuxR family [Sporobacter termitidis DSM 10068]|uniref:Stage 0 sporulation protein A homolog n=1 Tax=Sporobacter termitidis DSM 10068 TaxID=1123282 RepID=A0A1M5Z9W8_9FIRM|nr:response regulator transcription factor [Sporobacter termitidis]SHI20999.1 two component transcriptional regulator, LuxR family [Sporobacter termitidis DSM 10068]